MHSCQSRCVLIQFRYTMGEHRRSIVICFPIDWATANGHYDLVLSPRCSTGGRSEVHEGYQWELIGFRALPFCMLPLGEGRFRPACVFRLDLLETTIIQSPDCFQTSVHYRPRSASSEILIKQLISAGGISNSKDNTERSAIVSQMKMQGLGSSPGTSFRISEPRYSCSSASKPEITQCETVDENDVPSDHKKNLNSINNVARHLKILLRLPRHQEKKAETILKKVEVDDSVDSFKSSNKLCEHEDTPMPLWQQFTRGNITHEQQANTFR
ncbi:hypothetical protein J5N97_012991 [Dioscorea zingiberensis]|uniref:Uncharacterized protein n=1 Tax=Dioscorea zingiberensis TaxID=325984 RepID=A0A9D5CS43_9LILI|nr:hypothetical protein J5N97_012991 [Dioscorea zingiberensis]